MGVDTLAAGQASPLAALSDMEIVRRVRAGDSALFEILMRRHNQKVYRAVRAVLREERDAEDVMQQAYLNAFTHLHQFEERSQFSTWLIRISLNEAFGRRRKMRQQRDEFSLALVFGSRFTREACQQIPAYLNTKFLTPA